MIPIATSKDFDISSEMLTFKTGQSSKSENSVSCLLVHAIHDTIVEKNESFTMELISSEVVHVGSSNATTVDIIDDQSDGKSQDA